MSIPVNAPLFDQSECRNDDERRFLERLNERAKRGDWAADSWSHTTDHVLIASAYASHNNHDIRADYFGDRLLLGGDETGQYVTELDPADPEVTVVTSKSPEEMADIAADWFEDHFAQHRVWVPSEGKWKMQKRK
jgi:hypothetical protein